MLRGFVCACALIGSLGLTVGEAAGSVPCFTPDRLTLAGESAAIGGVLGIPAYLSGSGRVEVGAGVGTPHAPRELYRTNLSATGAGRVSAQYDGWGYAVAWNSHAMGDLLESCPTGFHQVAATPTIELFDSQRLDLHAMAGPQMTLADHLPIRGGAKFGLRSRWRVVRGVELDFQLVYLPTIFSLEASDLIVLHPVRGTVTVALPMKAPINPIVQFEGGANYNGELMPWGAFFRREGWYMQPYVASRIGVELRWGM